MSRVAFQGNFKLGCLKELLKICHPFLLKDNDKIKDKQEEFPDFCY